MKNYRDWSPLQPFLLPPSPMDWLPENHLAWFILELVQQLDMSPIEDVIQGKDPRGTQPYHPRMMTALLLYAYAVGVRSSRKIERATYEDVAFRVLAGGQHPDHWTINHFRSTHWDAFKAFFVQVLRMAQELGLLKLGTVALDGTKVRANASKHKAMSYNRMLKEMERLEKEVEEILKQAEAVDAEENAQDIKGKTELPAELERREKRLQKIRAAKQALEKEARQARAAKLREQEEGLRAKAEDPDVKERDRKAAATLAAKRAAAAKALDPRGESEEQDDEDGPDDDLPEHRVKHGVDGTPDDKAQRNFTDPDSRIMVEDGTNYVQAYNCQAVVDEGQFIVSEGLSNQPPDVDYFRPLLQRVRTNLGSAPERMLADAGYWSTANAEVCEELGTDAYISVDRMRPRTGEYAIGPPPDGASPKERMRHKVATKEGTQLYSRRKVMPEPVFGQIKEERGFRRFSVRGIEKVRGEWTLVCLVHNLIKMWRAAVPLPT